MGNHPHGQALEYLERMITIDDHEGVVMVKKNYAGEGDLDVLKAGVPNEREKNLASVTARFQRKDGYRLRPRQLVLGEISAERRVVDEPQGHIADGARAEGGKRGLHRL